MARATFLTEKGAKARELFDQGLSCNAIAKMLGVSPATVSRWAAKAKLSFDRERTSLAVRAHTVDLAESRHLLVQKMMTVTHDMLDSINKPFKVYNFGGKDNTFAEAVLDIAPVDAQRTIMVAAGIAFDKSTRILEKDNGGLDEAVGTLDTLAAGFAAAAEALRAQDETPADGA